MLMLSLMFSVNGTLVLLLAALRKRYVQNEKLGKSAEHKIKMSHKSQKVKTTALADPSIFKTTKFISAGSNFPRIYGRFWGNFQICPC